MSAARLAVGLPISQRTQTTGLPFPSRPQAISATASPVGTGGQAGIVAASAFVMREDAGRPPR